MNDRTQVISMSGDATTVFMDERLKARIRIPQLGLEFTLSDQQPKIRIGRDPENDLVLNHPTISAFHAQIFIDSEKLFLEDLASRNGTYINFRFVRKLTQIFQNCTVQFAIVAAEIELSSSA